MIKRKILTRLEEHLGSDQMTILIGSRQVGKTYLMRVLKKKLEKEGKKTVWLSLDNDEDKAKFASQAILLSHIELAVGKGKAFVFIDEIQRKENVGLFLKGIFDMNLPLKFIISGSGSLELKAKILESMAGRKRLFSIEPISFEEFVNFRTDYLYEGKLQDFFKLGKDKTERLFSEYMVFGGYPRVVLADSVTSKQEEMQEIYRSYVERDIRDLLSLKKTDAFTKLLKIVSSQIGSLVNIAELSSTVDLNERTIKHYLYYLEQTFIIKKVTPYYRNTRKEITKTPVYYFYDTGLRNWLLGLFGLPEIPAHLGGHLFENIVFNLLRERLGLSSTQIHFWRTRDQAEVDFVLEKGLDVSPMEAKYAKISKIEIPRSFRNFLAKYKPKVGYIIHLGEDEETTIGGTRVYFLPFYTLVSGNNPQF